MESVRAVAERWLAAEPDADVRDEIERLLDGPSGVLEERFVGGLEFGTAGLRAEMGAGPRRMNRLVVRRAAAGLADHLLAEGRSAGGVLVGFDARRKSRDFASDTARVLAARGIRVLLVVEPVPTPVVAWATPVLGAEAAVVVTASHNPPEFNGLKLRQSDPVYGGEPLSSQELRQVAALALGDLPPDAAVVGGYEQRDMTAAYIADVVTHFRLARPVRVVPTSGSVSTGMVTAAASSTTRGAKSSPTKSA